MKRRTFLAAAPLAAIGFPFARMASAQTSATAPRRGFDGNGMNFDLDAFTRDVLETLK